MGRFSPTVTADYGPGIQPGLALSSLADSLIRIRDERRRRREEEERKKDRDKDREEARRFRRLELASRGLFEGAAPTTTLDAIPMPTGNRIPLQTPMQVRDPNLRQIIQPGEGEPGVYFDFRESPEGRRAALDQSQWDRRVARDDQVWNRTLGYNELREGEAARAAQAAEAARQQRILEMARSLGLSDAEAAVLATSPKGMEDLADLVTLPRQERIRARFRDRTASEGAADPATRLEDMRRNAMLKQMNERLDLLKGTLVGDPELDAPTWQQINPIMNRADSLAATIGTPPPAPGAAAPGRPARVPDTGLYPKVGPEQAQALQRELMQVNALIEQARGEGAPPEQIEAAAERARQRIYRKYGILRPDA